MTLWTKLFGVKCPYFHSVDKGVALTDVLRMNLKEKKTKKKKCKDFSYSRLDDKQYFFFSVPPWFLWIWVFTLDSCGQYFKPQRAAGGALLFSMGPDRAASLAPEGWTGDLFASPEEQAHPELEIFSSSLYSCVCDFVSPVGFLDQVEREK